MFKVFGSAPLPGLSSSIKPSYSRTELNHCTAMEIVVAVVILLVQVIIIIIILLLLPLISLQCFLDGFRKL